MKQTVAVVIALLFVLPLLLMLATSLRAPGEAAQGVVFFPSGLHFENYAQAWRATKFGRQFANSLAVALCVTLGQIVTSLMAGYAFARMEFVGKKILFVVVLATIILPFQILVIPVFVVLAKLGWVNSYWALIVPSLANAFGIFLFTQFFRTIPYELEEAATLDGASRWTILWKVIVPLARPAVATLFMFTFIAEWNELFKPLVFTSTKIPLPRRIHSANGSIESRPMYGFTVMASAPTVSKCPCAYAAAVVPMSPRFASAKTRSPCSCAAIEISW